MSAPKGKEKLAVWMYPEIKAKVKEMYRQDDCRSMSEFVEKSIRFYVGYLTAENKTNYLPNMFLSCLRSIIVKRHRLRENGSYTSNMYFVADVFAMTQNTSKE